MNRNSPIPLYYQLKEHLLDEIESGRLLPGEKIPPEKELEQIHAVSRTTVRQAVDELVNLGLLYRKHGVGTFVAEPKLEQTLGKLTSFTKDIKGRGLEPSSRVLNLAMVPPTKTIEQLLGLSNREQVIEILRLRLANDVPVGLHKCYLTSQCGLSLKELEAQLDERASLYDLLDKKGVSLVEAYETLEAVPANEKEAELLGVPYKAPLLLITRIAYTNNKVPIEFCKMVYRADRYRYNVHLSS